MRLMSVHVSAVMRLPEKFRLLLNSVEINSRHCPDPDENDKRFGWWKFGAIRYIPSTNRQQYPHVHGTQTFLKDLNQLFCKYRQSGILGLNILRRTLSHTHTWSKGQGKGKTAQSRLLTMPEAHISLIMHKQDQYATLNVTRPHAVAVHHMPPPVAHMPPPVAHIPLPHTPCSIPLECILQQYTKPYTHHSSVTRLHVPSQ